MKRKEQLAQKREELANQKREELLRKHELQTVNAMIVGQEKERKRIANDLHDNINSEIVTAKIQLEHLSENITKIENPKKILDLCVTILDDTYHKTRNISHERNSGVMAQKELIPGIKKLAKKAELLQFWISKVTPKSEDFTEALAKELYPKLDEALKNIVYSFSLMATEASREKIVNPVSDPKDLKFFKV